MVASRQIDFIDICATMKAHFKSTVALKIPCKEPCLCKRLVWSIELNKLIQHIDAHNNTRRSAFFELHYYSIDFVKFFSVLPPSILQLLLIFISIFHSYMKEHLLACGMQLELFFTVNWKDHIRKHEVKLRWLCVLVFRLSISLFSQQFYVLIPLFSELTEVTITA